MFVLALLLIWAIVFGVGTLLLGVSYLVYDWVRRSLIPRVIYDRHRLAPYLTRWYLLGKPSMPDGSNPFDQWGAPREGIRWSRLPFGVYLHKIDAADDAPDCHNHPWLWATSLVLKGGYVEARPNFDSGVYDLRKVRAGTINFIQHWAFHNILKLKDNKPCWTLFVVGPKVSTWGFLVPGRTARFGAVVPWEKYLDKKGAGNE